MFPDVGNPVITIVTEFLAFCSRFKGLVDDMSIYLLYFVVVGVEVLEVPSGRMSDHCCFVT